MKLFAPALSVTPIATFVLSTSDWIELIGIVASLITGIIAIIISVKTLKQNSIMIEESTRPYIVVYREYVQVLSSIHEYLVIKNYGKTGATIDSLSIEPPYEKTDLPKKVSISDGISGQFLAPSQSLTTVLFANAFKNNRTGITRFTISYHTLEKSYSDTFTIREDLKNDIGFVKPEPSANQSIQKVIAKVTEEILRRNL